MSEKKDFIAKRIADGAYTISPRRKGRSYIWSILSEILKEDGTALQGFVYCRTCQKILNCCHRTEKLYTHKCVASIKSDVLKLCTNYEKKKYLDLLTAFLTGKCRPFAALTSLNYFELVKNLIKIGGKYGDDIDRKKMLPDSETLLNHVKKLAVEKRNEIKTEIKEVISSGRANATIDVWTDNYIKRKFLGVTLHYQKKCMIFDIGLGMKSMDFAKNTRDIILRNVKSLFSEYDVQRIESIKFVTDGEGDVVKTLEANTQLICFSKLFRNVLDKSFAETTQLTEILKACKKTVKKLKKAKINVPESAYPLRPSSNYVMLNYILDSWPLIQAKQSSKNTYHLILRNNILILKALVELCEDFEIINKTLQLCNSPSLYFVLPTIHKMQNICKPNDVDISVIAILKKNMLQNVEKILVKNSTLWHKAALFLYPPAASKQLNDFDEIKCFCVSSIQQLENFEKLFHLQSAASLDVAHSKIPTFDDDQSSENSYSPIPSPIPSPTPNHKNEIEFFFADLFSGSDTKKPKNASEEVDRYSREVVRLTEDFDLFEWWTDNTKKYPHLSKLAHQVHSIPASSAPFKRIFYLAGNFITDRERIHTPKSLDNSLFVYSYYKCFN